MELRNNKSTKQRQGFLRQALLSPLQLTRGMRVDIEDKNGRSESNSFESFEPSEFQDRNGGG